MPVTVVDMPEQAGAEELASLRETVREVCAASTGGSGGSGYDSELWETLGRDVGLAGLGLPEYAGGIGGLAELAVVTEELGRALAPVPLLSSTVLAGQVLARCGPAAEPALRGVAAGEVHALVAVDADGCWRPGSVGVSARGTGTSARLTGTARFVLDGAGAAGLVVAASGADGADGVDVYLAAPDDPGVDVTPMRVLDPSRAQATVTFTDAPARRLTGGGAGGRIVSEAIDVALVALAAEQLGGAQACLDMTIAYVRQRTQFGRAIGSFQAVKHRCADMLLQVEAARSAVLRAVDTAGGPALAEAAAVAAAWCAETFGVVAAETVHLHGGVGITWEHVAHHYLRRATADAALLGGAAYHRERLATLLGW